MNIIVPLLGSGKRFRDAGYTSSKPLVRFKGKESIFWLLDGIVGQPNVSTIMIAYKKELDKERFSERIYSKYGNLVKLLPFDFDTSGAAHTLLLALENSNIDLNLPVVSLDVDTFYGKEHIPALEGVGNCIFYFEDRGKDPIFSYLLTNDLNQVTQITEKVKISDRASVGTYCFDSGITAIKYAKVVLEEDIRSNGEHYVSSIYRAMLNDGVKVFAKCVKDHTCIGTPMQLQSPDLHGDRKIRICFDLDNTLVTEPRVRGDYSTVEPIIKNIEFLRLLKQQGHTVILWTARGMISNKRDIGKLTANIGKVTFDSLEKFQIPFDEIHFGKPYADLYIDDKAVGAFEDLEKITGLYRNEVISREYNHILQEKDYVVKSSSNASMKGEIFWYRNAPRSIEHLFPRHLDFHEADGIYGLKIQKIQGPTFSSLLTNGTLQRRNISELISAIKEIHESSVSKEDLEVNIYSNYFKKVEKRFLMLEKDFQEHKAKNVYGLIQEHLKKYEENRLGQRVNVHGDLVFTNVLYDESNRVKLIDMRGMQGDTLTIVGDANYDYAKVCQSLMGYDFVVRGMEINNVYLTELRKFFFDQTGLNEKMILGLTASLLLSCIPLQPKEISEDLLNLAKQCI